MLLNWSLSSILFLQTLFILKLTGNCWIKIKLKLNMQTLPRIKDPTQSLTKKNFRIKSPSIQTRTKYAWRDRSMFQQFGGGNTVSETWSILLRFGFWDLLLERTAQITIITFRFSTVPRPAHAVFKPNFSRTKYL